MFMSRLSSVANKLLMLMFMLMLASLVRTGALGKPNTILGITLATCTGEVSV